MAVSAKHPSLRTDVAKSARRPKTAVLRVTSELLSSHDSATREIQNALDVWSERGGGTVILPAGRWRSGPIALRTGVELRLDADCILTMSGDVVACEVLEPVISAIGVHDAALSGPGRIEVRSPVEVGRLGATSCLIDLRNSRRVSVCDLALSGEGADRRCVVGCAARIVGCTDVSIGRVVLTHIMTSTASVSIRDGRDVRLEGLSGGLGSVFLELRGRQTRNIRLRGEASGMLRPAVVLGVDVPRDALLHD
jgi:hypothetical protein